MRRQTPLAHLLYSYLFPNPSGNDPASFSAHLARNLVPEVRVEVATFYGDLNSAEARYPGLNYCHPPHRMRLGRFKHHRRLFEAFDTLGLTYNEIQDFCCWEGTRWARERYEKDEGIKVLDTTGDEIGPFVDRRERGSAGALDESDDRRCSITRKTDISVVVEDADIAAPASSSLLAASHDVQDEEMSDEQEDEEDENEEDEEDEGDDIIITTTTTTTTTSNSSNALDRTIVTPPQEADALVSRMRAQLRDAQQRRQRRQQSLDQHRRENELNQWLVAAWNQGQALPPEIEQFLKEQTERGVNVDAADVAHLSRYLASRRPSAQRYSNGESGSTAVGAASRAPAASA